MTMKLKTKSYRGFAVMLGALSLIAVACSDDDDDGGDDTAGKGGSSAGKGGSSAGKGGGGSAGKGGSNGGTAGSTAGGAGNAGEGVGGEGVGGDDDGVGGEGGGSGEGGGGVGGEATGGTGEGGAGGAPEIVWDTLDNGDISGYMDGWSETGDVDGSDNKWPNGGNEPEIVQWRATAYKVATWQTVSPLQDGTYTLSADVMRAATLNEHYIFAKGCKLGEPDAQVKQDTTAANSSGYTTVTLANIEVTSGSCTVGVYIDAPADGWANVDNFVFVKQ